MSKHHHQSKAEQIYNKAHGAAPFHHENMNYEPIKFSESNDFQESTDVDGRSIQLRAYQIYNEKGKPALDKWLEKERISRHYRPNDFSFIL